MNCPWWTSRKTINDYISMNTPTQPTALFHAMRQNAPWVDVNAAHLDLLYLTHSGNKFVSNFFTVYVPSPPATNQQLEYIGSVLLSLFGDRWNRLWELTQVEYNPIENYSMTEKEDYGYTDTTNRILTREGDLYGFNSVLPSHATKNVDTETNNTLARIGDRELTRSGNIGTTTTQQMMESSIQLYHNWLYFENVFNDIDSILTIPIY